MLRVERVRVCACVCFDLFCCDEKEKTRRERETERKGTGLARLSAVNSRELYSNDVRAWRSRAIRFLEDLYFERRCRDLHCRVFKNSSLCWLVNADIRKSQIRAAVRKLSNIWQIYCRNHPLCRARRYSRFSYSRFPLLRCLCANICFFPHLWILLALAT